jgi:hypothetical protein
MTERAHETIVLMITALVIIAAAVWLVSVTNPMG